MNVMNYDNTPAVTFTAMNLIEEYHRNVTVLIVLDDLRVLRIAKIDAAAITSKQETRTRQQAGVRTTTAGQSY